ncbi:RdgB/HAM1 family non-canonical purine NTP pyrophosphatase [Schaalia sp. 19OD2882]|uniref:RdgB/HAM1 family non-canonical purine NTP pyrophosphatase n=1 Tax=Schaalia sp. 19OD2882 TaxID=2794089 RepID=UPI001C1EBE09|nr:RdgB/HAM1 family non-canonical purine NTP pyrophosphatase [Schaalia sp. 19OD2882]QWW20617.1 RdgB/HAM1 family non-canonical purine NTP pyrophosphatase [Schaalia sp. 19OD2882]
MRPRLVFATGNAHKISELEAILAPAWQGYEAGTIARMSDLGAPEPIEDGASFEENSLLKARALVEFTGLPAIADDSGLSVEVMGGAPGIFSARWCGRHGDDAANLDLLLAQLTDVPDRLRGASFVSVAALVLPDGREFVERGEVHGRLLRLRRGEGGFGYDPIFVPDGFEETTAQMSPEQKNAISHRGIAFRALTPAIVATLREGEGVLS